MIVAVSIFLSFFAGLTQFVGYLDYGRKSFTKRIKPNAASWGIWAFGALLESISYIFLTKDWVKNILPVVCALSAIIFFFIALKKGYFLRPTGFEWFIIVADIIIIVIWFFTSSPALANILFIITAIVSFIPMIKNVYFNPTHEHALPWIVWSIAYILMSVSVIMRWEKWEDFIYPATFVILHVIIGYLALDIRRVKKLA